MKIGIIYYSMTGRNEKLSQKVSEKLGIDCLKITELRKRKEMTVAWDLIFNRTPKTMPLSQVMDDYDLVLVFAPVWMGTTATPVRAYLKYIKKTNKKYGFISLSGGAEESNPKLLENVTDLAGHEPEVFMDMHVSELLPEDQRTRETTQAYKVKDSEYEMFAERTVELVKDY